jgi:very-short-patch-repair endonuclease
MSIRRDLEEACIALALGQWGVITVPQAMDLGMSSSAIQRRLRSGAWVRIHRGVHRLREVEPSWEQSLMAACLRAGGTTAASHRAAARLLELGIEHAPTEITSSQTKRVPRSIRFHCTDSLPPVDLMRVRGIPVTTASRTLIDLGAVTGKAAVESALEAALRTGSTSIWHLVGRLDELGKSGRRGTATIRAVLRERDPRLVPTASELESILWATISSSHLPLPERQFHIWDRDGLIGRCDFAYPADFLVIEAQSARWHLSKDRWLSDMERRNRLTLAGWRVLEIPWHDVVKHPRRVIDRIDSALSVTVVGKRA